MVHSRQALPVGGGATGVGGVVTAYAEAKDIIDTADKISISKEVQSMKFRFFMAFLLGYEW
ncbi:MAG: hypothetical protein ACLQJ7_17760 [Syntrophobacteraceae bacterium]